MIAGPGFPNVYDHGTPTHYCAACDIASSEPTCFFCHAPTEKIRAAEDQYA